MHRELEEELTDLAYRIGAPPAARFPTVRIFSFVIRQLFGPASIILGQ